MANASSCTAAAALTMKSRSAASPACSVALNPHCTRTRSSRLSSSCSLLGWWKVSDEGKRTAIRWSQQCTIRHALMKQSHVICPQLLPANPAHLLEPVLRGRVLGIHPAEQRRAVARGVGRQARLEGGIQLRTLQGGGNKTDVTMECGNRWRQVNCFFGSQGCKS